ncbi:MAG: hypothetical protein PHS81_01630 [Candidatus Nanoarchaeia archaeon]|nr:hypothetical protein [Candidatus Nanoarchaeia archaeon]
MLLAGCTKTTLIPLSNDFEIIRCDALNLCPEGKECYSFQDTDYPICWQGNPCNRCASNNCIQLESYPVQIRCE